VKDLDWTSNGLIVYHDHEQEVSLETNFIIFCNLQFFVQPLVNIEPGPCVYEGEYFLSICQSLLNQDQITVSSESSTKTYSNCPFLTTFLRGLHNHLFQQYSYEKVCG